MRKRVWDAALVVAVVLAGLYASKRVFANAGPFVVKFPGGNASAEGGLAAVRLDLRPGREEQLRVIREDLAITFLASGRAPKLDRFPRARVVAAYRIENPTDETVTRDFGFPVVRGEAYIWDTRQVDNPEVKVDGASVGLELVRRDDIYGVLRRLARGVIEKAMSEDAELQARVLALRAAGSEAQRDAARSAVADLLATQRKWSTRDVALLVAFAGLDLGAAGEAPELLPGAHWVSGRQVGNLRYRNQGALAAIGREKATQLLTHLSALFNAEAVTSYEGLFQAWGGDVRERSVDLTTGEVRPRISAPPKGAGRGSPSDPTVYARQDYLDEKAAVLTDADRKACRSILQDLPVTFTFASMSLLHYRIGFAPHSSQTVTVSYMHAMYADDAAPRSYQLAYVIHPASLWKDFGPINLKVTAPEATPVRASVPCATARGEREQLVLELGKGRARKVRAAACEGSIADKTGELFVAMDAGRWDHLVGAPEE